MTAEEHLRVLIGDLAIKLAQVLAERDALQAQLAAQAKGVV